jgi:hypothetical protein
MKMNDAVQAKLREIVIRYGVSVIDEPLRCQGLLNDLCPSSRREINSLILVLKAGVPVDLLKAGKNTPRQALCTRLSRQVTDNIGLSEDVARWAVESWARAVDALPPGVQARRQAPAALPAKSTRPIKPIKPIKPGRLPQQARPQQPVPGAATRPAKAMIGSRLSLPAIADTVQHPVVLTSLAIFIISGLYLVVLSRLYGGFALAIVVLAASGGVAAISSFVNYPRIRTRNMPVAGAPPPPPPVAAPKGQP